MGGIYLSKEHGVNPSISQCFFCLKDKNEIVLTGKAGERMAKSMGHEDGRMPMSCVMNYEPCDECKGHMKQGVIIISIRDGDGGDENPYRTGGWWVVKDVFFERLLAADAIPEELIEAALTKRCIFFEDTACTALGLEKGNTDGEKDSD